MNFRTRLISVLYIAVILICCNQSDKADRAKHYSEQTLQGFEKIYEQQRSRLTATFLLDSLYGTFPSISAADKIRYYDFKQRMFEVIRFGNHSYDTAISYLDTMLALIEDNGLQQEMSATYAKAFYTRGEYYTRIGRFEDAITDITRCRQLNEQSGDSCMMAENTKTLSAIAINQSDFVLAAGLMKEALRLVNACKTDEQQFRRMQRYLDDLGYIYASQGKYDSALNFHLAAVNYIEHNKKLIERDTLFPYVALENIYSNIGIEYGMQNKFEQAENYLKQAIFINEDILQDSVHLAIARYWLGTFYLNEGRLNEAEMMAGQASLQASNLEAGFRGGLLTLQASIARKKQQYKAEAIYREQLARILDSLNRDKIELLQKSPFIEYERLDKKYQVELLQKDIRNQQNRTTAAIYIGILLTLLAVISLYLLWRLRTVMNKRAIVYNKLVNSERELKETMQQKEAAEKQLIEKELFSQEIRLQMEFNEAIIQQRRKISDDMHDELSSSLAALRFYVEDIKIRSAGTAAEKQLSDITDEVNTMYQNARSYMHSLKTNNWETRFSLVGFLKEIRQKFSEKGLMDVTLSLEEENIKSLLTTQQHDQLYHIIKESISNIIKHAGATEVIVAIRFEKDECIFSIADNGKGFKNELAVSGIGLQSMKKRIKDLNGELNIHSPLMGTTIEGWFPI